ncbi:uncharacterized protein LOC121896026 isoform X1 [Scomber scombrus]|uniref:Uncharacterized protein LOC121896026 isoform X1 n=1 Tax=Scomber scombrus TaxID=13677 RepID=A0AAV1Q985_SCOSC
MSEVIWSIHSAAPAKRRMSLKDVTQRLMAPSYKQSPESEDVRRAGETVHKLRIKLRMNIHQVLFFCFLSALQDGNTGLTNAIQLYAGAEGGNGSLSCYFTSSGNTKFFCKGECKEENILIKTDDVTAQSGKYSIKYEDGSSGTRILTSTFTQLIESDSGRYRFGLGGSLFPDSYCDVDLIVTDEATLGVKTGLIDAGTEGGSVTYGCGGTVNGSRKFFCKDECKKEEDTLVETEGNRNQSGRYSIEYIEGYGLSVTITQLKKSDTGWYKCGYGRPSSPNSFDWVRIFVVDAPTTEEPNWTLRPFPTSVPSASTPATTQSLISSSGSFTPSSSFPETTEQFAAVSGVSRPGYFWPLVLCVPVIVVLVAVVLLFVYKPKMMRNPGLNARETSYSRNMELSVHFENRPPVSMSEDPDYQSLDAADMDPDQTYSAFTETTNM